MPIQTEQIADEPIILATLYKPFEPDHDTSDMFTHYLRIRQSIDTQNPIAFIIDFNDTNDVPDAFSRIVFGMAEAAKGIRKSRELLKGTPPVLIFVGSDELTKMVASSIIQEQYGGSNSYQCASIEEAMALAYEKIADATSN